MLNITPIPRSLRRYESTIRELEQYPVEQGALLLYGSSFFRNWGFERARVQLDAASGGQITCVNHGFGGATIDDLLYYFDRMVRPYTPKSLIIRGGVNDIFKGYAPHETAFLLQRLIEWANTDNPSVRIILLGIFDTKRFTEAEQLLAQQYNSLCRELCNQYDHVFYLDLNPFFYEHPEDMGSLQKLRDVFLEDGLHLTDAAYAQMSHYFAARVQALLK